MSGRMSGLMRVLLRDEKSGSYVGRETAWTASVEGAAHFETLEAAIQRTLDYVHEDVVVVLRHEDPKSGLALNRLLR